METKVLTPKGFALIGDIAVGDQVCNPDGTVSRVIGVFGRGRQQFYRVTLSDGSSVEASADHLWAVSIAGQRKRRKADVPTIPAGMRPEDEWNARVMQRCRIVTTEQLAELVARSDGEKSAGVRHHSPQIPLTAPVALTGVPGRWPMLPPYTLGALIGDGYLSVRAIKISSNDPQIIDRIREELGGMLTIKKMRSGGGRCGEYRLNAADSEDSELAAAFIGRDGLLGCLANNKFIPERIKLSPAAHRLAFIQGLFDTDGHMDNRGHVEFSTVSHRLATDTQWMLRSLGYRATLTTKQPHYTYKGERRPGQLAYRLHVQGPNMDRLFGLHRKASRVRQFNGGEVWPSNRVESVVPTGEDIAKCIRVDHPNGLYVTDDFIVTHNTDLGIGAALTSHRNSIVFRREYPQLKAILERSTELVGDRGRLNANSGVLRCKDGRIVEFGSVPHEKNMTRYQGRPHDLVFFDEAPQFSQAMYRFLIGWNRTTIPGQRCRVILAGNPPTNPEGRWIVSEFAPWLDPEFHDPATPGELRWYSIIDGELKWFRSGGTFEHTNKLGKVERITPRSRTFIPARLDDNPALRDTGYMAVLQGMPEPLRSQMLYGDFNAGMEDDAWQVIPTAWIRAAQARWKDKRPEMEVNDAMGRRNVYVPLSCLGVDVARGGACATVLVRRYGRWFAKPEKHPGKATPDGPAVTRLIHKALMADHHNAQVNVDAIGVGASVFDECRTTKPPMPKVTGVVFSQGVNAMDKSGLWGFRNLRAYAYWKLREALDPVHGDNLEIPPDQEILADLCAPRWEPRGGVICLEEKAAIIERIGRSPDVGDALVLSHCVVPKLEAMVWAAASAKK